MTSNISNTTNMQRVKGSGEARIWC